MNPEILKLSFEGVQTAAIVGGAIWAVWRFQRERVDAPQIEFSVDAKLHGPSDGQYVSEYILTFRNKGKIRVETRRIELRVLGIKAGEQLREWREHGNRLEFREKLVDDKYVIPKAYRHVFFEPGITQEYVYVGRISADYRFILIRGLFYYDKGNPHSAERVVGIGF